MLLPEPPPPPLVELPPADPLPLPPADPPALPAAKALLPFVPELAVGPLFEVAAEPPVCVELPPPR